MFLRRKLGRRSESFAFSGELSSIVDEETKNPPNATVPLQINFHSPLEIPLKTNKSTLPCNRFALCGENVRNPPLNPLLEFSEMLPFHFSQNATPKLRLVTALRSRDLTHLTRKLFFLRIHLKLLVCYMHLRNHRDGENKIHSYLCYSGKDSKRAFLFANLIAFNLTENPIQEQN